MKPHLPLLLALTLAGCDKPAKPAAIDRRNPHATTESSVPAPAEKPAGMRWIPGGTFTMGSDDNPVEKPAHRVVLEGFWMDETEVTHGQFGAFVKATGYVTSAEKTPKKEDFPDALPCMRTVPEL